MLEFFQLQVPKGVKIDNLQHLLNEIEPYAALELTPYFKMPEDQTEEEEEWLDAGNEKEVFVDDEFLMVFSLDEKIILVHCDQDGMEEVLGSLRFCNNSTVAQFFESDPHFKASNEGNAPLYGVTPEIMEDLKRIKWVQAYDKPETKNFVEFYGETTVITVEALLHDLKTQAPKPIQPDKLSTKAAPFFAEQKREGLSISHSPEHMKKFDESGKCEVVQADGCTVRFWM